MPFSQTTRALEIDLARFSLIGLIVMTLFLFSWLAWFWLASFPLYETSEAVHLSLAEALVVDFPAESQGRIKPGQPATLYFKNAANLTLPAEVVDVTVTPDGPLQVWLQPRFEAAALNPAQDYIINRVDIAVDRLSPIDLFKPARPQVNLSRNLP